MDQCKSNLKCMCVVCDCVQYFFGVCPKTQAQYSFSFCLNFNNRIEHSILKPLILSNILSALQNHLQNIFLETVIWPKICDSIKTKQNSERQESECTQTSNTHRLHSHTENQREIMRHNVKVRPNQWSACWFPTPFFFIVIEIFGSGLRNW